MRRRLLLAKWGLVLASGTAAAQLPPGQFPQGPRGPGYPTYPPGPVTPASQSMPLPQPPQVPPSPALPGPAAPNTLPPLRPVGPAMGPQYPANPANPVARPQEIPLPQPENKFALNAGEVTLKRIGGGWQLWAGRNVLRDFGDREMDARDALRVYRDLRATEWVTIGSPRPVVEYGLVNGRPPMTAGVPAGEDPNTPNGPNPAVSITNLPGGKLPGGNLPGAAMAGGSLPGVAMGNAGGPAVTGAGAKVVIPIDLRTVRVEAVRGVWTLRDDANILFNFGANKGDAEQAAAVVRRYGFNRVGMVGAPAPVMTYLFAAPDAGQQLPQQQDPLAKAQLQAQIDGLNRVGIPVAGVGYVGEMIRFDPRKLEVRKDGAEWVVASGAEVIGRYGPTEWAARDAARTMADAKFTEFGKVGSAGVSFFLSNGQAPTRVPFHVQGRRFDPAALKVNQYGERFAVTENGRHLFDCASAAEGETLIRVVQHYRFDQLCHLGPTPKLGVSFLAKGR